MIKKKKMTKLKRNNDDQFSLPVKVRDNFFLNNFVRVIIFSQKNLKKYFIKFTSIRKIL